jgi:hypothetical protein
MYEVVPDEEGFLGSQPEADETQPVGDMLSQDSTGMSNRRDGICNAMWAIRGTGRV